MFTWNDASFDWYSEQRRGAAKWFPDAGFLEQYKGVVLFPTEETKWLKPIYNGNLSILFQYPSLKRLH